MTGGARRDRRDVAAEIEIERRGTIGWPSRDVAGAGEADDQADGA